MKIFDLLRIAIKTLKSKWTIFSVIGISIGTFCLCFAVATWTAVRQEKFLPYELVISSSGTRSLTSGIIAEISEIPDVKAVSALLEIPVSIKTGKYEIQLTLTGIDAAYLQESFSEGDVFPDNSVMPYIVLNEAACKQFVYDNTSTHRDPIIIDWLNAGFSLEMGDENKAIPAKVCGILDPQEDSTEQVPKAYISLAVAKELLRKSGQSADSMTAYVRITNSGKAESMSNAIAALGMTVTNSNAELQTKWDVLQKEMSYLIVMGAFGLICSAALFFAWRKIFSLEQKEALETLYWLGMSPKSLNGLHMVQSLATSILGSAIGLIISLSLPPFLSAELEENSVFFLPIPLEAAVVVTGICIIIILLPMLNRKPKQ